MSRYIDADLLKTDYYALPKSLSSLTVSTQYVSMFQILNTPTADVVERKKGKWIKQNPLVDTEECSLCKYNIYSEELETPFCPWCGAQMEANYEET